MQSLRSRKEKAKSKLGEGFGSESIHDNKQQQQQQFKKSLLVTNSIRGVAILVLVCLVYFVVWFLNQHTVVTLGGNMNNNNNNNNISNNNNNNNGPKRQSLFKDKGAKQVEKKDKNGKIVHKAITSVKREDLRGLIDDLPDNIDSFSYEDAIKGREELMNILQDAGVEDMDVAAILSLPKWSTVTRLYGTEPVVIGLETCQQFRDTIPLDDASIAVAGMFNTGTNPFAMYLERNCLMPHNTHDKHGGTRWQVPWGKHTLASRKWTNTAGHDGNVNKTNILPVVIVRDPYSWMQSMCKHPYAAKWPHRDKHCPNLVPNEDDLALDPSMNKNAPAIPVTVHYTPPATFDSLAHYWTQWYQEYLSADYPRLIVRFEDLQFHAKEMVDMVCQCAGAVARSEENEFTYIVDSGKWGAGHKGTQTNMISAMIKYGTDKNRLTGMTKEDMELAATAIDPELMKLFHYDIPSI